MRNIKQRENIRQLRRPLGFLSGLNTTLFHLRNPWVVTWWSAAFPGFGHIMLGNYLKGFLLIGWEFFTNHRSKLNKSIFYSFTGEFEMAKNNLDLTWATLYIIVYVFAIWDTHRSTVDLNKYFKISYNENSLISPVKITFLELNFLDKRSPWLALAWSLLIPGLGHFYCMRILTSIFLGLWWVVCLFYSGAVIGIFFTIMGDFSRVIDVISIQWLLFMPSIYGFAVYDSYNVTVEYNKLFEREQALFLKNNYQNSNLNIFNIK